MTVTTKCISANRNFLPFSSNQPNIIPANISGYTVLFFQPQALSNSVARALEFQARHDNQFFDCQQFFG
jgi:hypothetical protein